jgi:hypothetical protein
MTRSSHLTDDELARYLEGEVTQSRAGQIALLTSANTVEAKKLASLEQMFDRLATPDPRTAKIDLVAGVREKIAKADPPERRVPTSRLLLALCAVVGSAVFATVMISRGGREALPPAKVHQPAPVGKRPLQMREERKREVERAILSVLSLAP